MVDDLGLQPDAGGLSDSEDAPADQAHSAATGNATAYAEALQVAYRFIAFRPRTVGEVRKRLSGKFSSDAVCQVIDRLISCGYLDDAQFADLWRSNRERRRPRGTALLRRELRQKGVADEVIDGALEGVDDLDNACRAGRRRAERWRSSEGMDFNVFRRKMWEYLQRRGFGPGVTSQAVKQLWDEVNGAAED